jgi:hypothetical protein
VWDVREEVSGTAGRGGLRAELFFSERKSGREDPRRGKKTYSIVYSLGRSAEEDMHVHELP